MIRVHITLQRATAEQRARVLTELLDAAEVENVNTARFERHGVVSADIPEDRIELARHIPGVKSVVQDSQQRALGREPAPGVLRARGAAPER